MSTNWHLLSLKAVFENLQTSRQGLKEKQVAQLRELYGPNELPAAKKYSALKILVKQFTGVMILVLLAGAILSVIVKEYIDAIVILIIVLLNAVTGFVQEYRAEKAMDALKKMACSLSTVVRGGATKKINAAELVPGDIVLLEAGTKVQADVRLIEAHALQIDESSLTGESVPVSKTTPKLTDHAVSLNDRSNMAFSGTNVTYGRGKGIVTATGIATELGTIAKMLQQSEPATPLQLSMADLSRKITFAVMLICAMLFITGFLCGQPAVQMLLLSLSVAVATIPEALPVVITISLSLGARRLVKQNALVRKLFAVETLGAVSFICTDKTGTLTQNKMKVAEVWVAKSDEHNETFLKAIHLNHDVEINGDELLGDPTEVALVMYLNQHPGYDALRYRKHTRTEEIPFDTERKAMTTIHKDEDRHLIITKGAVETIATFCPDIGHEELTQQVASMTGRGLRVIAYAYKRLDALPGKVNPTTIEKGMKFLGIAGLIDPPREEAKLAISECRSAGIIPVMLTGDHLATAVSIARTLGILTYSDELAVTGIELDRMPQTELEKKIDRIRVYARVSPAQKLRIIKAIQAKRHFVAMTGDGVNDAPSVKLANIGIAMGITGTDVTKEAAHMILLDDNFATIIKAVKHGRRIYDNIRKFIQFIMAGNTAELLTIVIAPVIGLPLPLLPVQILWINLVTDGLPALALAAEPADKDIMTRPPRRHDESIFSNNLGRKIIGMGIFIAVITVASQYVMIKGGVEHWQTIVFSIICFSQLWQVMALRSSTETLLKRGLFTNQYLLAAVIVTIIMQLAIIYSPVLQVFFHTEALSLSELAFSFGISSMIFWVLELTKFLPRKVVKPAL